MKQEVKLLPKPPNKDFENSQKEIK